MGNQNQDRSSIAWSREGCACVDYRCCKASLEARVECACQCHTQYIAEREAFDARRDGKS